MKTREKTLVDLFLTTCCSLGWHWYTGCFENSTRWKSCKRAYGHLCVVHGHVWRTLPMDHYCDIHKTALGNPELYFESMDRRIRAHPTPAVFSLENGIESFPDTLVECREYDGTLSGMERTLKDVRLLSKREQMHNLATLAVYKGVLEFIIEVHRELV